MEKGLIHIYTGKGKGKTTAAMGLVSRASGYNKNIYILQFLKGRKTGEKIFFEQINNIQFERAHKPKKFIKNMNKKERKRLKKQINQSCQQLKKILRQSEFEIIVLDEIFGLLNNNVIEINELKSIINEKNKNKELILTGRKAPSEIIEMADYVTEMKKIKHPYSRGISARKGIEY